MKKRKSEVIESLVCRELVLVDSNGGMVAQFTTINDGTCPSFRMYDKNGTERWIVEIDNNILRMCFRDNDRHMPLAIAVSENMSGIKFYDKSMNPVGEIYVDDNDKFQIRDGESNSKSD